MADHRRASSRGARHASHRTAVVGIRQHRHALRQVPAAGRGRDARGEIRDAGQVHALTGACPTVALHVLWDLPRGLADVDGDSSGCRARHGVRAGSINPNLFQDQHYKFGSFGNPDPRCGDARSRTSLDSVAIAQRAGVAATSRCGSPTDRTIRAPRTSAQRKRLVRRRPAARARARSAPTQRLLVEYKPFEPAFYHTDIADWGMALLLARAAGPQAQGARRHRPSLPVAEHRADRRVAARRRACSAAFISTIAAMPTTT